MSYALHAHLIQRIKHESDTQLTHMAQLLSFLLSLLRVNHVHTAQARAYVLTCADQLAALLESKEAREAHPGLVPALASVLLEQTAHTIGLRAAAHPFVERLTSLVHQAGKTAPAFAQSMVLACAYLLHSSAASNPADVRALVGLLSVLLDRSGKSLNRLVLAVCAPPVLAVVSSPVMDTMRPQASALLEKLQKLQPHVSDAPIQPLTQLQITYTPLLAALRMHEALEGSAEHVRARLDAAITTISKLDAARPLASASLLCFFAPFFVAHNSLEVRTRGLQLVSEIIAHNSGDAFSLLPALLHQLGREVSPALQITLLYTVVAMAKYEPAVPTIFRAMKV